MSTEGFYFSKILVNLIWIWHFEISKILSRSSVARLVYRDVEFWIGHLIYWTRRLKFLNFYQNGIQTVGGISSERTCTSLDTLSSYKHFYWCHDVYYLTNMYTWKFKWKCWTSFCYHTKEVSQNQVKLPYTYTLCVTFSTHNCRSVLPVRYELDCKYCYK
jgi:hypothetical protein